MLARQPGDKEDHSSYRLHLHACQQLWSLLPWTRGTSLRPDGWCRLGALQGASLGSRRESFPPLFVVVIPLETAVPPGAELRNADVGVASRKAKDWSGKDCPVYANTCQQQCSPHPHAGRRRPVLDQRRRSRAVGVRFSERRPYAFILVFSTRDISGCFHHLNAPAATVGRV